MHVRRIVTGVDTGGRSVFADDGPPPRAHQFVHVPGQSSTLVWATGEASVPNAGDDRTPGLPSVVPGPGSTVLVVVTLPPDSVYAAEDFDPQAAFAERDAISPGLLEHFEEGSGFHATPTVDYVLMLEGELWLVLDEGETAVRPGDIVVQNGTRHAWQNRSNAPATFAAVLVGASR